MRSGPTGLCARVGGRHRIAVWLEIVVAVAFVAGVAAGCSNPRASGDEGGRAELTVFAAASLRDVFAELQVGWAEARPDVTLIGTFDGSNVLATQITEGAPADVFLSADAERPRALAAAGLTAGNPIVVARNSLVLVAPTDRPLVQSAADLAQPGVRIIAAGAGVPITTYAEEALAQIAATMPDPATFLSRVEANVVSREDNVRAALAKVELGEGDAAIVYATDALSSDLVRIVPLPPSVSVSTEVVAVQISTGEAPAALLGWLAGPDAAAIFSAAGFRPVSDG